VYVAKFRQFGKPIQSRSASMTLAEIHHLFLKSPVISYAALVSIALAIPAWADPTACPASMSPAVEKKLLSVLDASTESVLDEKTYDTMFDQLLCGKDDASIGARVALMDYPIGAAYSELLSCVVSTGGKKALYYLELYSRCDIAPTRSRCPVITRTPFDP
jgi:hypothetical protein